MDTTGKILDLGNRSCSGCGACEDICPKGAVVMRPDERGFLYPHISGDLCISCRRCEKVCPELNPYRGNREEPVCYAAAADDSIRRISSSGGVFTLFAQPVLKKGGSVCGAMFRDGFSVGHGFIEKEEELDRLRRSKYVQSDTRGVYRELRKRVSAGEQVLFSGCPCQVAAARNCLEGCGAKEGQVLFIDIICHGVPSPKMWSDYLAENFDLSGIRSIQFRNKLENWRADELLIFHKNGKTERLPREQSAYEKGFMNNTSLRDGCEACIFAAARRQGDITVGDFWGIEARNPDLNDGKGISVLLVNNETGRKALEEIRESFTRLVEVPLEWNLGNRMRPGEENPLKNRFKELYPARTFTEAAEIIDGRKYDIGLVAHYCVPNYGAELTQFALYHFLREHGYTVLMIERPADCFYSIQDTDGLLFESDPFGPDKEKIYPSIREMKELNRRVGTFITGSDQMFNPGHFKGMNGFQCLNFVTDDHKKIAYAASWGFSSFPNEERTLLKEGYFLQKFDYFSVREDTALKIAEDLGIRNAAHVLDPVFLCGPGTFAEMAEERSLQLKKEKDFIFLYILDQTNCNRSDMERFARGRGLETREITGSQECIRTAFLPDGTGKAEKGSKASAETWLAHFTAARYVITDSFHGVCFSILFQKQFLCVLNEKRGATRFRSLLKPLHLEDRICRSEEELRNKMNEMDSRRIDYQEVNGILKEEKDRSAAWLLSAVKSEKITPRLDGYDVLDDRIEDTRAENQRLSEEIRSLQTQVQSYRNLIDEQNVLIRSLLRATKYRRKIITAGKFIRDHGVSEAVHYTLSKIKEKKQHRTQ